MAVDRVTIRKRGAEWQVRHRGKTVYICGSQQGAMEYVAGQLKARAAAKELVGKFISNYMKGRQQ